MKQRRGKNGGIMRWGVAGAGRRDTGRRKTQDLSFSHRENGEKMLA